MCATCQCLSKPLAAESPDCYLLVLLEEGSESLRGRYVQYVSVYKYNSLQRALTDTYVVAVLILDSSAQSFHGSSYLFVRHLEGDNESVVGDVSNKERRNVLLPRMMYSVSPSSARGLRAGSSCSHCIWLTAYGRKKSQGSASVSVGGSSLKCCSSR